MPSAPPDDIEDEYLPKKPAAPKVPWPFLPIGSSCEDLAQASLQSRASDHAVAHVGPRMQLRRSCESWCAQKGHGSCLCVPTPDGLVSICKERGPCCMRDSKVAS